MTLQSLPHTTVHGFCIRTNNRQEMAPDSGKIGPLWQRFSQDIAPLLKEGSQVFGVYCHYESDEMGEFDVIAGTDQSDFAENEAMVSVTLTGEKYLAFDVEGPLPQGVINTWQTIWQYFAQPNCPYQRSFQTDVEHYITQQDAIVYISIR